MLLCLVQPPPLPLASETEIRPLARPDSLSLCGTVRLLGGYDLYFDVGEDALVALHLAFELAEFLDV